MFEDTSEMLAGACTLELMVVEFHNILTSMLMVSSVSSASLIDT